MAACKSVDRMAEVWNDVGLVQDGVDVVNIQAVNLDALECRQSLDEVATSQLAVFQG